MTVKENRIVSYEAQALYYCIFFKGANQNGLRFLERAADRQYQDF
jgi:hypothetical protein